MMITVTVDKQKLNQHIEKSKRIGSLILSGLALSSSHIFQCGKVVTKEIMNELKKQQ